MRCHRQAAAALLLVVGASLATGVIDGHAAAARAARAAHRRAARPTIVAMRHAEPPSGPADDAAPSTTGGARVQRLAFAVSAARVGTVFTTQSRPTRDTAAPRADHGDPVVTVRPMTDPNASRAAELRGAEIRRTHAGRTVAVTGHSNTVPAIVTAIAAGRGPALGESDLGDPFVLVLSADLGPARALHAQVGSWP